VVESGGVVAFGQSVFLAEIVGSAKTPVARLRDFDKIIVPSYS
jgi:hypothetical protein